MKLTVCRDCGKAYEAQGRASPCPRCAKIDSRMPSVATAPPPDVVIPGPESPVMNTMADTQAPPPDDFGMGALPRSDDPFARFVSPQENALERYSRVPDTMPCPRCAETIKTAAKMCRFCELELDVRETYVVEPSARAKRLGVTRSEVVRFREDSRPRRRASMGECYCGSFIELGVCFSPRHL